MNILITGAGGGLGQGIIKSLKMIKDMDIKIIATDICELSAGLYASDIACLVERCDSLNYLTSLKQIFSKYKIDYYIPGTDNELIFCANNKINIKNEYGIHTVVSNLNTIWIANDKYRTYEFLKNHGFSYPKTDYLKNIIPNKISFPVIVKPVVGCRSIGVHKVYNIEDLIRLKSQPENLLVQECIGSESAEYTCTVVKANEKLSPVLALKRVLRSGDTYRAEPEKSELIESYVQQVASKIHIDGGCNFQLRIDRQGNPKIFEINSRFSGTTPFCAQLGFNPLEFYLKQKAKIEYKFNINYESIVLRHWAEVVVQKDQLDILILDKELKPVLNSQFSLF